MVEVSDVTLAELLASQKESLMDNKISCIDESNVMADVVLHYLADKFISEVSPYITPLRFDRYLTCATFFDCVAADMKKAGTILIEGACFKPTVKKETIH